MVSQSPLKHGKDYQDDRDVSKGVIMVSVISVIRDRITENIPLGLEPQRLGIEPQRTSA